MCGIAGYVGSGSASNLESVARRMADQLKHRGPDDEGIWVDAEAGVALSHRRLSIIDLSPLGHQPMRSAAGRYVVAYNGEIYNFAQIRSDLDQAGLAPVWRGHSDTEVLLAAVEAWGIDEALRRAVGMFAIALWDRELKTLTLARDRVGEKPLYYGRIDGSIAFASELKSIGAIGGQSLEIDRNVLAEFMQFGYILAPRSIYKGIFKLAPGHVVTLTGSELGEPRPYWSVDSPERLSLAAQLAGQSDADLVEALHVQLKQSVGLQMVSDVPLGAFLSGGVDSSTVVALMQSQSARRIKTYTIGFQDKSFDEAPYARAVAQHLGTDHTELYVTAADAAALIPELPFIYDEPFADSSQIPTTLVSRMTREHVTVALSGDGGDELFAGYPRYQLTARLWKRVNGLPMALRMPMAAALRAASPRLWDSVLSFLPKVDTLTLNGRRIHRLAQTIVAKSLGEMYVRLMSKWQPEDSLVLGVRASISACLNWPPGTGDLDEMRRWDIGHYLPDDLLVKVDRAAMSTSLETRAPLLDHQVVELAFSLPEHVLVRDGVGKWPLRRVLDKYVPRTLIDRPKAGFAIPIADWLRGPLRDWAQTLLAPQAIDDDGLLDTGMITSMWREHLTGKFDRSSYLWNILMFQAWLRHPGRTSIQGDA